MSAYTFIVMVDGERVGMDRNLSLGGVKNLIQCLEHHRSEVTCETCQKNAQFLSELAFPGQSVQVEHLQGGSVETMLAYRQER